jgi:UrcA family protein
MFFTKLAAGFAVAGASLACATLNAQAQPNSYYDEPTVTDDVGGVTVYAPYRYARQPTTGARVRMDTVSMVVPIDDLDLNTSVGARIAKARISEAAKEVCDETERAYPGGSPPPGGCYATAVRDALRDAQAQAGYPIVAWGYR